MALLWEARLRWISAQIRLADEGARNAAARFRAAGDLWGEAELDEPIAAALWLGQPGQAEALIHDLLTRAERIGHTNIVWACKGYAADLHMAMGNLEEAERAASAAFDYGQSISAGWLFVSHVTRGSIAHYRGNPDEACVLFRRGLEIERRSFLSGPLAGGLFRTLAAKGDPGAAAALANALPHLPVPGRPFSIGACGCLAFVIEGLALLGRLEEAGALEPHAEHVVANGPFCVYSQHLFRTSAGIAAACARNWTRAEEHHQTAIHQADTAPYRVAQPIARSWYAEMLLARDLPGDRERARGLLNEALNLYESIGMPWHARRAAARLSAG